MPGRNIAIGDIHGCSAALSALIDAIGPRPEDTIVTLGDYINRGPDSRGVLDRLIDLGRNCRLAPILGNHDQKLLEARSGLHPTTWLGMGGLATLDSYGPGRDIAPSRRPTSSCSKAASTSTRPRAISSSTPTKSPTSRWPSSPPRCCGGSRCGT